MSVLIPTHLVSECSRTASGTVYLLVYQCLQMQRRV